MDIETTVTITPTKEELRKDKEYHLKCYRLKRAIQMLNRISADFATGKIHVDNDKYAIIDGISWG